MPNIDDIANLGRDEHNAREARRRRKQELRRGKKKNWKGAKSIRSARIAGKKNK